MEAGNEEMQNSIKELRNEVKNMKKTSIFDVIGQVLPVVCDAIFRK